MKLNLYGWILINSDAEGFRDPEENYIRDAHNRIWYVTDNCAIEIGVIINEQLCTDTFSMTRCVLGPESVLKNLNHWDFSVSKMANLVHRYLFET